MTDHSLTAFSDVARVLSLALEAGGGEFLCANRNTAISWRHRAYRYRRRLQAQMPLGTPFDGVYLTLADRAGGQCAVVINTAREGQLMIGGKPVDIGEPELSAEEAALLAEIDLDVGADRDT